MCPRVLTVGVCFLVLVGCKRGSKDTGPSRDDLASAKPQPAPSVPEKAKKDEPNWLTDARVQSKKDQLPVEGAAGGGKEPWNVGAPAGGFQPPAGLPPPMVPGAAPALPPAQPSPNPMAGAPGTNVAKPAPGGVGALAPGGNTPLGAAKRVVAMADMRDLQVFIDTASLVSGKMPTGADIFAALMEARSPTAALVKEGAVILTGTKERESVWAFEANAYLKGGLVVTQNGVETVTAEELKKRLGK